MEKLHVGFLEAVSVIAANINIHGSSDVHYFLNARSQLWRIIRVLWISWHPRIFYVGFHSLCYAGENFAHRVCQVCNVILGQINSAKDCKEFIVWDLVISRIKNVLHVHGLWIHYLKVLIFKILVILLTILITEFARCMVLEENIFRLDNFLQLCYCPELVRLLVKFMVLIIMRKVCMLPIPIVKINRRFFVFSQVIFVLIYDWTYFLWILRIEIVLVYSHANRISIIVYNVFG